MNQNEISLKDQIVLKLKNSSIQSVYLNELLQMIDVIFQAKQKYQEFQLNTKHSILEDRLQQLSSQLTSLIELCKKNSGMRRFLMSNSDIQNEQQKISKHIAQLHSDVNEYNQDYSLITLSSYTKKKLVIDMNVITIKTTIKLYHPKIIPIKSHLKLILKQGSMEDNFELAVLKKELIQKIKEKAIQNLDKNQEEQLKKFDKNQTNMQVFIIEYQSKKQITTFSSEIYPYIITPNNQNRIYLCKEMKLKFFPNQTLIVLETDTKNQNLRHFSTVYQFHNINQTNSIKLPGYGYIKFMYSEMDKVQYQGQNISSKGTTFEFYLKNQNIKLSNFLPLINATLFHDENGFYILPIKTELQNYYQLFYDKQIKTKDDQYKIGVQIQGKGWIQIEQGTTELFDY